jgi:hypothetical protein
MRFVNDIEFKDLCDMHRRMSNIIEYETTNPDSTGKYVKIARVTYKYKTQESRGTFTKLIDEYCTFYFANIVDT